MAPLWSRFRPALEGKYFHGPLAMLLAFILIGFASYIVQNYIIGLCDACAVVSGLSNNVSSSHTSTG